jgi:hypothetical protein
MNATLAVSSITGATNPVSTPLGTAAANVICATPERSAATAPQPMAVAIALGLASLKLSITTSTARNTSTGTRAIVMFASSAITGAP